MFFKKKIKNVLEVLSKGESKGKGLNVSVSSYLADNPNFYEYIDLHNEKDISNLKYLSEKDTFLCFIFHLDSNFEMDTVIDLFKIEFPDFKVTEECYRHIIIEAGVSSSLPENKEAAEQAIKECNNDSCFKIINVMDKEKGKRVPIVLFGKKVNGLYYCSLELFCEAAKEQYGVNYFFKNNDEHFYLYSVPTPDTCLINIKKNNNSYQYKNKSLEDIFEMLASKEEGYKEYISIGKYGMVSSSEKDFCEAILKYKDSLSYECQDTGLLVDDSGHTYFLVHTLRNRYNVTISFWGVNATYLNLNRLQMEILVSSASESEKRDEMFCEFIKNFDKKETEGFDVSEMLPYYKGDISISCELVD